MRYSTTITPKYQVHIPSPLRRQMGLSKHGKAAIYAEGPRIIIEPARENFLSLSGVFRVRKPIPAERIRKAIAYVEKKK